MAEQPGITRRLLLRDMGKASLAVVVFGAAACSPESEAAVTTTTTGAPSTTLPRSSATPTIADPTTTQASITEAGWSRVDLGNVSAYIVFRNGEAAVIDTGNGGSASDIEMGLSEFGVGWSAVGQVVITHHHRDHQGSLEAVLGQAGNPPWYAGAADMGAISASTDGNPVGDGDRVFDMDIIETPGHTPGSISVHDRSLGLLIAGDALNGQGGGLVGANPSFTADMDEANDSIRKLAELEFDTVVFGHGDPVINGGSGAVKDLAASL